MHLTRHAGCSAMCVPPSTPVCPSKGRVNPGRLSSPTWKRPSNGCLPQSANALAEAEGGSGAGAALRRGSSARSRSLSWDCCLLGPPLSCYVICQSQCPHSRQTRRGVWRRVMLFFLSLSLSHSGSEMNVRCGGFLS